MMRQGVIEKSSGLFASNLVLVKKKDGNYRCCGDYQQLNDLTIKDAFPLPHTDDCLDALSGCCWFTSLDMLSGYHQLDVVPEDRDNTAFVIRRGLFRYRTLPFGLTNAVGTFSHAMTLLLAGLNFEVCLAYLDDIMIMSRTPDEDVERPELVLDRLVRANLKLKPSKCNIMQTSIQFLGHTISANGVELQQDKVRLIRDWSQPKNLKELQAFLGTVAEPLNQLLKKDRTFDWTPNCEEAFGKLKQALMSSPVLALPNRTDPMIIDTDASDFDIGCVLLQVQDGQERVISYAGRTLNLSKRNYCTTRKELLAIVYFVRYFKQYLLGRPFTIRTDHSALTWLRQTREPIGQNARWLTILEEYQYSVVHPSGWKHNANSISRHPCVNKLNCMACHPEQQESSPPLHCQVARATDETSPK